MQNYKMFVIAAVAIAMMMIAGCTSSEAQKSEIETPTVVPTVVETVAPTAPVVVETPAIVATVMGKITVSAPHKATAAEVKTVEVFVDGKPVGTAQSNSPKTFTVTEGTHTVKIVRDSGETIEQTTKAIFGKTVSVEFEPSEGDNAYQQNDSDGNGAYKFGNILIEGKAETVGQTRVVAIVMTVTNTGTRNTETHKVSYSGSGFSGSFVTTLRPGESQVFHATEIQADVGPHRIGTPHAPASVKYNIS
jgi:hypothetical protein